MIDSSDLRATKGGPSPVDRARPQLPPSDPANGIRPYIARHGTTPRPTLGRPPVGRRAEHRLAPLVPATGWVTETRQTLERSSRVLARSSPRRPPPRVLCWNRD